ncbi:MAG TPA: CDP-diacylglycerol--glycerol-3-phosphate 3-phosphatidyltransferase [Smithellaceae bacterium]|nr:CDP-diacylglycerol--glycerol-3-phosphate 3-phosphatidyltransferase [Smithellaceae bacterium]HRS88325.1 CDP-diacylglycerol--glycerol-3-phosphate 3-phosphatidyltransferase [Smithellaceae bacterium]HRV24970.1 CDP-diacylglycerol--glycerol-3-phosphate 3-phosphatidyltransferase [Smithellaceae bacterium]
MNIPNFLSVLRIVLVPVIIIFLLQEMYLEALVTFGIAGLTDVLDGVIARAFNRQTTVGAFIDPLADKLLLSSMYITLAIIGLIPSWLTVLVISRDFIITLGILVLYMMSVKYEMKPAFISKVTTVLQIATILFALLYQFIGHLISYKWVEIFFWITAAFTIASGFTYITKGIKYLNRASSTT